MDQFRKFIKNTFPVALVLPAALILVLMYSVSASSVPGKNIKDDRYTGKEYPAELARAVESALDEYPSLRDVHIEFKYDEGVTNTVMQAQPKYDFIFRKSSRRRYQIKMRPKLSQKEDCTRLHELPADVLRGWFAHELGHICDYLNRSNAEMLSFGIQYITSDKFLQNAERRADSFAVVNGLGASLIKMKNFIVDCEEFSPEYKLNFEEKYPSCRDIKEFSTSALK